MKNTNVAIIPIRDNSKRLKKKNFLKIKKKRLFEIVLNTVKKTNLFDQIILSSNNKIVRKFCNDKNIIFDNRPNKLCGDNSTVAQVCKYIIQKYKLKKNYNFCAIYPTAILLKKQTLKKSYQKFLRTKSDTLIGTSKLNYSPFKAIEKKNLFYAPVFKTKIKKKFHKNYFFSNGTFYWSKVNKFNIYKTFYAKKMSIFEVNEKEAFDLDTKEDWLTLKKILKK